MPDLINLDADDLTWNEHAIAGAEVPARITLLRADAERGTRTVMVQFPDGWRRDAVGNQPAGEEMVLLSGELSLSGQVAVPGTVLVLEPHATRAATSTGENTRAVVWFSGAGGGWAEGEHENAGSAGLFDAVPGAGRGAQEGLVGTLQVLEQVGGERFEADADVLWPQARTWTHVPAGEPVPDVAGLAVVHTF